MTAEWDEYVRKAQGSLNKVLSVGDTYVDQYEKLLLRNLDARKRIDKLLYWLDMDGEAFENLSYGEKADHLHMQNEVQAIKDILLGEEKADG